MQNISMSDTDLLKFAIENGMIDAAYVRDMIEMQKRKEILEKHPYKIWEGKDGKWYTYLPDEEKGRVLKKRKSEKLIQDCVVEYYIEIEQHPCFREAYSRWISEKEEFEEIGKDSITRYDNDFKRFFPESDPFCKIRLCDMTSGELERFIKRTIKDKRLTPKAYTGLRLILIGVFKFSKREGYTDFSISTFFSDLSLPKNIFKRVIKDNSREIFTQTELKRVTEYLQDNPDIVNLGLLLEFFTGTRVGELSSLKHEDNDRRYILKIQRTEYMYYDKESGKRVTTVKNFPKSESGVREILLPKEAQEILDKIKKINPSGEFLLMRNGKRITSKVFNYHLHKVCEAVGIPPRSTHKIRKTYGSILLSNNVDESLVLNQMGHSNISTTQNYYYYDILDDAKKFEAINRAINY